MKHNLVQLNKPPRHALRVDSVKPDTKSATSRQHSGRCACSVLRWTVEELTNCSSCQTTPADEAFLQHMPDRLLQGLPQYCNTEFAGSLVLVATLYASSMPTSCRHAYVGWQAPTFEEGFQTGAAPSVLHRS